MSALLKWLNLTWASVNAKFREVVSSGAELEVSEKSSLVMLASKHVLCLCIALRRRPGGRGEPGDSMQWLDVGTQFQDPGIEPGLQL